MIQSHEVPERAVEVEGKIKYRVDVQEVVGETSTFYTYEELEFPIGTPAEVCEAKVARYEAKLAQAGAQKYLAETDWVVVKINEATLVGEDVVTLKAKYIDILAKRAEARLHA